MTHLLIQQISNFCLGFACAVIGRFPRINQQSFWTSTISKIMKITNLFSKKIMENIKSLQKFPKNKIEGFVLCRNSISSAGCPRWMVFWTPLKVIGITLCSILTCWQMSALIGTPHPWTTSYKIYPSELSNSSYNRKSWREDCCISHSFGWCITPLSRQTNINK